MLDSSVPTRYPAVGDLKRALDQSFFKTLGKGVEILSADFRDSYLADFEKHLVLLRRAYADKSWPNWAASGYVAFNRMIIREELAFRKSGVYSAGADDIERITTEIYENADVMTGYYLVGLYLTYFIWPHHYSMLRYFKNEFLAPGDGEVRNFAEWGVGHGLLSLSAMARWRQAEGWLVDLSEHSLEFARRVLAASDHADRCRFIHADILTMNLACVDRLVCSEVLEHVPNPGAVLERACQALAPTGQAFLTAAVNAPQADHVYLFEDEGEVLEMVNAAGLKIRSHISVNHPHRRNDERPPRVVGMIVEVA